MKLKPFKFEEKKIKPKPNFIQEKYILNFK